MENNQEKNEQVQIPVELAAQLQFQQTNNLVQYKIKLVELALEFHKTNPRDYPGIEETYLDLREEILGIPNHRKD